ncbi:MAG TPA: HNH endonuclease [Methanosarcina sp.]|nr:HNH endonuclease [Methanosarcina sp.]
MYKTIEHYPNYEISTDGIVRNKTTGNNIKWVDNGKGYQSVKLYNSNTPKGRLCLVHRLVMSVFNPTTEKLDVNHKDGNKRNNSLSNLEWVTKSANTRHAHTTGLFKNKLTVEQVKEIKAMLYQGNMSYSAIGRLYEVRHSTIWKIANGSLYDYV